MYKFHTYGHLSLLIDKIDEVWHMGWHILYNKWIHMKYLGYKVYFDEIKSSCKQPWGRGSSQFIYLNFKIYVTLYVCVMLGETIPIPCVHFVNKIYHTSMYTHVCTPTW